MAEVELGETVEFYEQRQSGLGKAFLDAVPEAGERIQRNPQIWAFYEKPIRSYKVAPFSYRLLYRELPDRLQVVAVFHLSRRPGYWKDPLS